MDSGSPQRKPFDLILEELGIGLERIRRSVKAKLFGKPAEFESNASPRVRYTVVRMTKGKHEKGNAK